MYNTHFSSFQQELIFVLTSVPVSMFQVFPTSPKAFLQYTNKLCPHWKSFTVSPETTESQDYQWEGSIIVDWHITW